MIEENCKTKFKPEHTIPSDPFALMHERAAAEYLGVSARFLQNRRIVGGGPKYIRISSRCIRYRLIDLIEFTQDRLVQTTSEKIEKTEKV